KDKLTYTFHLNPNAKFHDGTPITAEDVKFSTQIVSDPTAMALGREEIMDAIESIEVIDPLTVRMKAKELRYNLLDLMSHQVYIVPKAIYSITKNLQGMKKTLVCSGPYKFISWSPGQKIILQRFDGWSGNTMPEWKGFYNFEKIVFKFYSEPHLISEFAKKGEIDFSEIAPKDVDSIKLNEDPSALSKFIKVENFQPPVSDQYAFNFRNPRFQSQKVREALAYALNRPLILKKIMSNNSSLMASPFGIHSPYADGTEKPRPFDLKKAKELLKQDGWVDSDQNGILDKVIDGKKIDFVFTMTYGLKSAEPALTIFAEDLKSIGVEMKLQLLDSANFFDNLHKGHFEMAAFSWKATEVESDQKQIYHSASANG
ncbi:MAG TPA: ABC transporter substrate-binding protein, partial [Pseudobdellovibrionaceae bacterium]|nr:ABC transporter substrate-binding protein [Pseudobdellovibrionaceae bacterium]